MSNLLIEVEENGIVVKTSNITVLDNDTIETIAQRASTELGIDLEEIIENIVGDFGSLKAKQNDKDKKIKIQRVCVELHFESKEESQNFSSNSKWSKVHRWGCRKFKIAPDACANLELRENSAEGPVINENGKIGSFSGCKIVWLVKPGAEPNGSIL
ncbi:MAG TPA: hypothetical protein PKY82_26840 [Pyrinomonadaceae bacterium]|nr:hypothetical protein [Pyrinomonadaceae bacterium]